MVDGYTSPFFFLVLIHLNVMSSVELSLHQKIILAMGSNGYVKSRYQHLYKKVLCGGMQRKTAATQVYYNLIYMSYLI